MWKSLTLGRPTRRDGCLTAVVCFYVVWCLAQPRYEIIWETGSGPVFPTGGGRPRIAWATQARMDRWTGLEEHRGVGVLDNAPHWHPVRWLGLQLP